MLEITNILKKRIYRLLILSLIFSGFLFILIWFYIQNYSFINSIKEFSQYYSNIKENVIDKQKIKSSIDDFDSEGININEFSFSSGEAEFFDKTLPEKMDNFYSNLYFLKGNFDRAEELLNGNRRNYYFNLANIELIKGYTIMSGDKKQEDLLSVYEQIDGAMEKYNISSQLLGTGAEDNKRYKITYNRNVAEFLKFLAGERFCVSFYNSLIDTVQGLSDKVSELKNSFQKERKHIKDWGEEIREQDLKKCLNEFYDSVGESYLNVTALEERLQVYKESALDSLENGIQDPQGCISESESIKEDVESASSNISSIVDKHNKLHSRLLEVLKDRNKQELKKFCDLKDQYQNDSQQLNENLEDSLKKMENALGENKGKQQQEKKKKEKEGERGEEGEEEKKGSSNEERHKDIPEGLEDELKDAIRRKSQEWTKEMNELKGEEGYSPEKYLEKLFDEFQGSKEGFGNERGGEVGKEKEW